MALNINTRKLNDSLHMLNSFLMQNKLGELSNQRYMETISEQDRLMRERQAADDVRSQQGREQAYDLNVKQAVVEALLKSNGEPTLDRVKQDIRTYEIAGNPRAAEASKEQFANLMTNFIQSEVKSSNGVELGPKDIENIIVSTDLKTLGSMRKMNVDVSQFKQRMPIEQQQANTASGNLALARTKEGRETSGELPQAEYSKVVSQKIQKAMDNINSLITAMKGPGGESYRLIKGAITPELLAERLTRLSGLESESMTKRLSPERMAYIDKSLDLFKNYIPGTEQLEADVNASIAADEKATSPTAQTIHPVGEKKTVVINGVTATYIWDGAKWLLSDSK